jgi:hypothetical protein
VSHARDIVTTSVTVVATRVHSLQREQSQLQHAVHDVNAQLAAQSQPVPPPAAVDVELLQRLDTVVRLENDVASLHTQLQAAQAHAVLLQRVVQRDASERQRHHADIVAVQAQLRAIDARVSEMPVRNISLGRCVSVGARWPGTASMTSLQPAHQSPQQNTHIKSQHRATCNP